MFISATNPYVPGTLFTCEYLFYKHDRTPLILVSGVYNDPMHGQRVGGLNLHYLTFVPTVKNLINQYCGNGIFRYTSIKMDRYVRSAFRTYKTAGLRFIKVFDPQAIKPIINKLKSLNVEEIEAMRKDINKQLKQKLNEKIEEKNPETKQPIPGEPVNPPEVETENKP